MKTDFDIPAELQKIAFATLHRRLSIVAPMLIESEKEKGHDANHDLKKLTSENDLTQKLPFVNPR